jgi:hypothetical protein
MRGWNAAVALITGCSVTFWASHKPDLEKSNTLRPREMGQGRVPESSSYGSSTCSDVKGKEKPIVHSGSLAFLRPLCQICRAKKCSPFPTGAMFAMQSSKKYVQTDLCSWADRFLVSLEKESRNELIHHREIWMEFPQNSVSLVYSHVQIFGNELRAGYE